MIKLLAICILFSTHAILVNCVQEKCLTIEEGWHFSSLVPFYGFTNSEQQSSLIKFDSNAANYIFESDDPKGKLCMGSWNKLFGSSRCGYLNHHHTDSDRFVWRRAQECLNMTAGYVNERENCSQDGLIELAGYAYDNGAKPFLNQDKLLVKFQTKVKTNKWYGYSIRIFPTYTIYELTNADSSDLLETVTIKHRDCGASYKSGTKQRLYFGGQCPAPQKVSVCYKEMN